MLKLAITDVRPQEHLWSSPSLQPQIAEVDWNEPRSISPTRPEYWNFRGSAASGATYSPRSSLLRRDTPWSRSNSPLRDIPDYSQHSQPRDHTPPPQRTRAAYHTPPAAVMVVPSLVAGQAANRVQISPVRTSSPLSGPRSELLKSSPVSPTEVIQLVFKQTLTYLLLV